MLPQKKDILLIYSLLLPTKWVPGSTHGLMHAFREHAAAPGLWNIQHAHPAFSTPSEKGETETRTWRVSNKMFTKNVGPYIFTYML